MALRQHGPRKFSNLEKAALDLVFKAYPIPRNNEKKETIFDTLTVSHLPVSESLDRGRYLGRHIEIGIETHGCADELGYCSALGNTDILKPGNMDYLNTFIHECTHHWQTANKVYTSGVPFGVDQIYGFTRQELQEMKFLKAHNPYIKESDRAKFRDWEEPDELLREQHASAVATWFVIAWQLKYTRVGETEEIDLTTGGLGHSVGTVDRYHQIKIWKLPEELKNWKPPGPGRWVPRQEARKLASDFGKVIKELDPKTVFPEE